MLPREHDVLADHDDELLARCGVTVARRTVLWLPAAWFAATALPSLPAQQRERPPAQEPPFDLAAFVAAVLPRATELVAHERPDEEAYLHEVAALVRRLPPFGPARYEPFPSLPDTEVCARHRQRPLTVLQFRVRPNAVIPLHNHAGYNGVMLGLGGEFRVRSFQPEAAVLPEAGTVRLREMADQIVGAGRVATLARHRDNLHEVTAGPDGGEALDVFTVFPGRAGRAGFFDLHAEPVDRRRRVYEATWREPR